MKDVMQLLRHTQALAFYICYMQSLKNDDIGKLFFLKTFES